MGSDIAQGQGAAGFLPGLVQNILAGPGYQTQDAQTRLAHMLITGGLAAAGQPAAAVGARQQFGEENAAQLARLSSPEFRDLPPDQQEALAAQEGIHLPRGKDGRIILPPVEATKEEAHLKATTGITEIEQAMAAQADAKAAQNPLREAAAKARLLRATAHPVPPELAAAETEWARQANEAVTNMTTESITQGPGGPVSKLAPRPEQFPAAVPGEAGAPAAPGGPARDESMPVETSGPGNPATLKEHTGGPPDIFNIDRGDGKGLRPWKIVEAQDGSLRYQAMNPKEVEAATKRYEDRQDKIQEAQDKAVNEQLTAHAAAQSVKTSLLPLAKAGAFTPAAQVAEHRFGQQGYTASQYYYFHSPDQSNSPQQQFSGAARQALAKVAASLKMRPGPRSLDALEASHYRPGDTLETVTARLGRLSDLPDNELRALIAEHWVDNPDGSPHTPSTEDTYAAPAAGAAMPAHEAAKPEAGAVDPDVAAILRARRKRK